MLKADLLPSAKAAWWRGRAHQLSEDDRPLAAREMEAMARTWERCPACGTLPRSLDQSGGQSVVVCPQCGAEAGR